MYMMIEKSKTYHEMTKQVVMEHVENIRRLEICGVLAGLQQAQFAVFKACLQWHVVKASSNGV